MNECNIDITAIPVLPTSPQIPRREHINAKFDADYTDSNNSEIANILREHHNKNYPNHIEMFAGGSGLDPLNSGAGFINLI